MGHEDEVDEANQITVDEIMNIKPCVFFSRARVAHLVDSYGPFGSWVELAQAARAAGWPVPIEDVMLTAYRAASPAGRLAGVQHSTIRAVEDQSRWLTNVTQSVVEIRRRLCAWASGDSTGSIAKIRADAYEEYRAEYRAAYSAAHRPVAPAYTAYDTACAAANYANYADNDGNVEAPFMARCTALHAARIAASAVRRFAASVGSSAADAAADAAHDGSMWDSLVKVCSIVDAERVK